MLPTLVCPTFPQHPRNLADCFPFRINIQLMHRDVYKAFNESGALSMSCRDVRTAAQRAFWDACGALSLASCCRRLATSSDIAEDSVMRHVTLHCFQRLTWPAARPGPALASDWQGLLSITAAARLSAGRSEGAAMTAPIAGEGRQKAIREQKGRE